MNNELTTHSIEPHDLIEVTGHDRQYFYRVLGIHMAGLKGTSVVTIEAVNANAPFCGEGSRMIAIPLIILDAGFSNGTFSHYKRGPYPLK